MGKRIDVTLGTRGAGQAWTVVVGLLLLALAFPAAARTPKSLDPEVAPRLEGKTLVVETTTSRPFMVGPGWIADRDEYAQVQQMLGEALPQAYEDSAAARKEGMWAVDAGGFGDPGPGIASALATAMQQRYGLVVAADAAVGDYLLVVEPVAWQLYHRSVFTDPAYVYSMKATLFEMPARTPLVARGCSYFNWDAVEKKPFLLNYFGDDAAAFRADIEQSRNTCSAELVEKMLPKA